MGGTYAAGRQTRPELIYRYKVRAMAAFDAAPLMRGGNLLDFGSADGLALGEMIRLARPKEALGIEYSDDLLEKAVEYGFPVIQGDVENLPAAVPQNHYNVVTALAILEHLKDPVQALREAYRVLIPGGTLVVSAPNPFWDELAGRVGIHKEEEHHEQGITPKVFARWCTEASLIYVGFRPFMFLPTAFLPYLKLSIPVGVSCYIDNLLQYEPLAPLFVNQLFIAQKPV